jgi:hypothetical protein
MKTAIISDYKIGFPALSPVFRLMEKYNIKLDPLVRIPAPNFANVVEYLPGLKNHGYEKLYVGDKPDAIVYLVGDERKYFPWVKMFISENVKILYLRIDASGALEKC